MVKRNHGTGQGPVIAFMQKHPGMVYTSATLADELGLDHFEHSALGATMNRLHKAGLIDRLSTGKYVYREQPTKKPTVFIATDAIYEGIGIRKSTGNVIVKDADDNLFELHEL